MKNSFKFGFLALAMAFTVAACNSATTTEEAAADAIDSTAEVLTDSLEAQIDTIDSVAAEAIDSVQN
jgi:hypothetical protein